MTKSTTKSMVNSMVNSITKQLTSEQLVDAMQDPASYPHPLDAASAIQTQTIQMYETHISWVFIAPPFAYKIKKPVKNDFLDYSTFEKRRQLCIKELELDKRFASEVYLQVVPISLVDGNVCVEDASDPIEFAVKMRQFPHDALLSEQLNQGKLTTAKTRQLAGAVASFHKQAAVSKPGECWAEPASILRRTMDNFDALWNRLAVQAEPTQDAVRQSRSDAAPKASPKGAAGSSRQDQQTNQLPEKSLTDLKDWTEKFFSENRSVFRQRIANGFVRECHGDLHLDNVIDWHGKLMPFDGIEFNDEFRWIDVLSDAAFLAMDFAASGHPEYGHSFTNAYLEQTGDYESLSLLRWYLVYRALVRAKVALIRANQPRQTDAEHAAEIRDCDQHIDLACRYTLAKRPALWITHGLSGSGKTTQSEAWVQQHGAIRIRSDIERKRIFGLAATDRPSAEKSSYLYSDSAGDATYGRLSKLARGILQSGFDVIVDATFLRRSERDRFRNVAESEGVPFHILHFDVDVPTLRNRIESRMARNDDASDANLVVLQNQIASLQPLAANELHDVIEAT